MRAHRLASVFVTLLLTSVLASTAGAQSALKAALCLQKHSRTTCVNRGVMEAAPYKQLPGNTDVVGHSGLYQVRTPNDAWRQLFKDQERKEDLVLIHESGEVLMQMMVDSADAQDTRSAAEASLTPLTDALGAEADELAIDDTVWGAEGVLLGLCYELKSGHTECSYSGAISVGDRMVTLYAVTDEKSEAYEDLVMLLASFETRATGP